MHTQYRGVQTERDTLTAFPGDIPLYDFPYRSESDPPFMIKEMDLAENWTVPEPDRHTFYALFWVTAGTGNHHIDFTCYPIRPQSLYLMRPGQTHFFEVDAPPAGYSIFFLEEFLYLNNHFQSTELFYLINRSPAFYLDDHQTEILGQIVGQLMHEYHSDQFGHLATMQHLTQILLIYLRRFYFQSNQTILQPTKATDLSSKFQQLVDKHFAEMHHVQDYADVLGITPAYLSEQVKSVTGLPAAHTIRQRIIIEAKRLLAHTGLTVLELCAHLGFKDSSYFARFFRRETGQAPLAFRRTYREKYRTSLN